MDVLSLIKSPIIDELEDFKNLFDHSLSSSNPLLTDVIGHLQQRNGKMMRPILVLLIAKLYGKVSAQTLHAAVSLELLHTASLVHDDVVDESAERRGQLSVNAIFNNKVAVLTGDFLLATCLVQASKTKNHGIIDVVSKLGQDLAEGELLQLSNINNTEFSESVYFDVINKKTAALFASCTKAAALSAQVDNEKVELARLFGEYIGICFQIKDDIFDYFDNADIGKPTGNDMFEGKLTLPVLFVLNNGAGEEIKRLAIKVKQRLASHQEISVLVSFTKDNGGILYAQKEMTKYKEKALDLLSLMPDTEVKESLRLYLDYVVDRHK